MPQRKPGPSFGVEFDRMLARARVQGNTRLVDHMERIRPRLNLASDDGGEIHANAAHQFGDDMLAMARALGADPFDTILMMAGACAHILNELQTIGINYYSANRIQEELRRRMAAEAGKADG